MEWLVDDFLVDPTSPFLQANDKQQPNKGSGDALKHRPSDRQASLVSTAAPEEELAEEELILESHDPLGQPAHVVLMPPRGAAAPGTLKRAAAPRSAPLVPTRTSSTSQTSRPVGGTTPGRLRRLWVANEELDGSGSDDLGDAEEAPKNDSLGSSRTDPASGEASITPSRSAPSSLQLIVSSNTLKEAVDKPLPEQPLSLSSIQSENIDVLNASSTKTAYIIRSAPAPPGGAFEDKPMAPLETGQHRGTDPPAMTLAPAPSFAPSEESDGQPYQNHSQVTVPLEDSLHSLEVNEREVLRETKKSTLETPSSESNRLEGQEQPTNVFPEYMGVSESENSSAPVSEETVDTVKPGIKAQVEMASSGEIMSRPVELGGAHLEEASDGHESTVLEPRGDSPTNMELHDSNTRRIEAADIADQVASDFISRLLSNPPSGSFPPITNVPAPAATEDSNARRNMCVSDSDPGNLLALTGDSNHASIATDSARSMRGALLVGSPVPSQVQLLSDFEPTEVTTSWRSDGRLFKSDMNQRGVFHVRVLRAQRLSCPVGSKIQATVSLLPWKGKVKTDKVTAFSHSSSTYGVCAEWDEEAPPISVTHAYSSEESPVPSLQVDVAFNPLGVFDIQLCSVTISCHGLLSTPLVHRRQWFSSRNGDDADQSSLVQIEAVFQPASDDQDDESVSSLLDELPDIASRRSQKGDFRLDEYSQSEMSMSFQSSAKIVPHLLRVHSHWRPARCCVCNCSINSGLRKRTAFRCEACQIDCCADCQLQVDNKLPCGSDAARNARTDAIQNRLTVDNILSTVAPVDESHHSGRSISLQSRNDVKATQDSITETSGNDQRQRIGTISFVPLRACVLVDPLPPHAEENCIFDQNVSRFRKGDYYVRILTSDSRETRRTHTVQSAAVPRFSSGEISFSVSHYGSEFVVELVDASTDRSIGKLLVTTQGLLQLQRDAISEGSFVSFFSQLLGKEKLPQLHLTLAMRSGVKKGFGYEFYAESKTTAQKSKDPQPGMITGAIELQMNIEEDIASLFGREPYTCPMRPSSSLDLAILQLHIARIISMVKDVQSIFDRYFYVISWKNPFVTALSLGLFVRSWSTFNPAYIGALPCCLLFFSMLYTAAARSCGRLKQSYIDKVRRKHAKAEEFSVDYTLHRPAGLLSVAINEGRNLRSELGLPGQVGCTIVWDPSGFVASERDRKLLYRFDKAADSKYDIATTSFQFSTAPKWDSLADSMLTKRLKLSCLGQEGEEFFQYNSDEASTIFPVLQPFKRINDDLMVLEPWHASGAAIIFEVHFVDAVSLLPGSVFTMGHVKMPFSLLVEQGEVTGWFDIVESSSYAMDKDAKEVDLAALKSSKADAAQLHLSLKWQGPNLDSQIGEKEREASVVIQEELLRASVISKDNKAGLLGNPMGALGTVVGISDQLAVVQNTLGTVLDVIGAVRSLFIFADPFKSGCMMLLVLIAWMFFALVPTKYLVLLAGLAQYAITFWMRFSHLVKRYPVANVSVSTSTNDEDRTQANPYVTWLRNAFLGLPTDEDLRKTYFWETKREQEKLLARRATHKRDARLKRLWKAQWYSQVIILTISKEGSVNKHRVFAMIQGHRLLWWNSVEQFDDGEPYAGFIYLAGHAGLATPSPIEMRALDREEFSRVVCIFGRQEKVTIITPSEKDKETLELTVQFATSSKGD